MFLITAGLGTTMSIIGYAMCGTLAACGFFFIIMECFFKSVDVVGEDIKSADVAKSAVNSSAGAAQSLL